MVKLNIKHWLFTLIITSCAYSYAQDVDNFTSLKSSGTVPEDFTVRSTEKYEVDREANEDDNLDDDFFLSTRFFIDDLLLSGKMLFNEPLSDYVSSVARYTLRREKKLYKELRFYVLKSTTVNAFSTDQGIIVFTTGLLAQLENEAQLAYIIAHEVSHYTEHHVRESYTEKKQFRTGRGKYQRMDYEDRISELSVYEKSNELEADKKGIEIFMSSEYAVDEIFSSFEMLLYSYLPFNEVQFDSTYFNTEVLEIPGVFFPDTINEITRNEDYDDHNSTHPNVQKRMDAAFDVVGDRKTQGDLKFKISETDFYKIRELARFESINLFLAEREYGKALYNIYLLEREHPNNRFLDLSKVKALYALAKYRNANRYREVTIRPKNIEGESYVLHYFLYHASREEMNVLAYRYAYDMVKKYPNDKFFEMYEKDMKKEMAVNSRIQFSDFEDMSYAEYAVSIEQKSIEFDVADSIDRVDKSEDLSKYEKIRLKKKLRAIQDGLDNPKDEKEIYYLYGLYDIVANGSFIDELKKIKAEVEREEEEKNNEDRKEELAHEPVRKLMVVDPIYQTYRLNNKKHYTKSEEAKVQMKNYYTQTYPKLNLETEIIDSKALGKESVVEYNELGLIFQWLEEVLNHDDMDMISSMHDRMEPVSLKYGTDHFMFSGVYGYKERNSFNANHLYGIMFFYTIPIVIVDLLIVHNYFQMVSFTINTATDDIEFVTVDDVNLKARDNVIQAYVYKTLYEISTGKNY